MNVKNFINILPMNYYVLRERNGALKEISIFKTPALASIDLRVPKNKREVESCIPASKSYFRFLEEENTRKIETEYIPVFLLISTVLISISDVILNIVYGLIMFGGLSITVMTHISLLFPNFIKHPENIGSLLFLGPGLMLIGFGLLRITTQICTFLKGKVKAKIEYPK